MQRILGRIPVYGVIQAALDTCLCVHAFFGSKINKILKKFFFLIIYTVLRLAAVMSSCVFGNKRVSWARLA
jgi:hypothetical protein